MGGNELRYGSLFSGIGGIDLGMDMAGFECAWQVEIDDYCRQILDKHWPGVPKYKDIYELKGEEIEPVDILCGGFPCQPVSVAGKRGGVDDERWLWDEFYRLICELRPRWVVAENVTGLFSANSGRAFAGVLRDLAESGYDAVWDVYPAGGPGGVGAPHRRERVFIVAHTDRSKQAKKSGDVREELKVSEVDRENISTVVSGRGGKDVANTTSKRTWKNNRGVRKRISGTSGRQGTDTKEDVADSKSKRHGRRTGKKRRITKRELQQEKQRRSKVGSETEGRSRSHGDVSDTDKKRLQRGKKTRDVEGKGQDGQKYIARCNKGAEQWAVEPNVGRVANGVSNRVDRLKTLGNAVVPQVAYKVARMIYEYTEKEK